jgi:Cdc6-like AAA superfamily ATPase
VAKPSSTTTERKNIKCETGASNINASARRKSEMAISISDLKSVRATKPPRVLIYGPPGMGKTTLASEWPNPVFLQVEDGTPGDIEISSFGKLESYDSVMESIASLYNEKHDRQTLVLDSLDRFEPLVWAKVCTDNQWLNMETVGYGKSYVAADSYWRDFVEGCNALRREKNMNIIYIAHSVINTVDDPQTQTYSRYDIRLHKRAIAIFQDEVDAIFFLTQDVTIRSEEKKMGTTRTRADGGGNRYIYASPRPSFVAKNRYGISEKLQYKRGEGYESLASHFPSAAPVKIAAVK